MTVNIPQTPDPYQRSMLSVPTLAAEGINGSGVLVAVVDSGIIQPASKLGYTPMGLDPSPYLANDLNGKSRIAAQYDAIDNILVDATHPWNALVNDSYGHGTHITSILLSSRPHPGRVPGFATRRHRAQRASDQRQGL